jgi:hypothetical protein
MSDDAGNIHIDLVGLTTLNIAVDTASPLEYIDGEVVTQLILSPGNSAITLAPVELMVLNFTMPLQQTPGLSAFQIAQQTYPGTWNTPQEWLASLKGPAGDSINTDPGDLALYFLTGSFT